MEQKAFLIFYGKDRPCIPNYFLERCESFVEERSTLNHIIDEIKEMIIERSRKMTGCYYNRCNTVFLLLL